MAEIMDYNPKISIDHSLIDSMVHFVMYVDA